MTTFDRLADPENGSNALSVFTGVLSKGGAKAIDDSTVEFTLDAPTGNFPYLASSDNYNAIILPKDYDGDWERTFIGTGPWKLGRVPARRRHHARPQRAVLGPGAPAAGGEVRDRVLHQRAELGPRVPGQPGRRRGAVLGVGRQGPADGPGGGHHRAEVLRPPPVPHALRRRAVQRQAHPSGRRPARQPPEPRRRFARHEDRHRQRQPVRARVPVDVARRAPARAERRRGEEAARGGRGRRRVQRHAVHVGRLRDAGLRPAAPAGPPARPNIRLNLSITDDGTYYGDAVFGNSLWLDSTDRDHRVRPPWRAERAARGAAAQRRHVEQRALQERDLRPAVRRLHRGRSTSTANGRRPSRSRNCCSTRHRSCSRTSTTSCRGPRTTSPAWRRRRWATPTSAGPASSRAGRPSDASSSPGSC